jgi:hypothetical protein
MTDLFESAWRKFVRGFFHGYYLQIELSLFNSEGQGRDRLSVVALPALDGRSNALTAFLAIGRAWWPMQPRTSDRRSITSHGL